MTVRMAGATVLVATTIIGTADIVEARGKAVPDVTIRCILPDPTNGNPGFGVEGAYSGIRTGSITRIEVLLENTTDGASTTGEGFVFSSARTTGAFVHSVVATEVGYDAGDSAQASVTVIGRRGKILARTGPVTCE